MSIRLMDAVWNANTAAGKANEDAGEWVYVEHRGNVLLMLLYLAYVANDEDGRCFPLQTEIAAATRIDTRRVQEILKDLKDCGAVSVESRDRRNRYRVSLPPDTNPVVVAPPAIGTGSWLPPKPDSHCPSNTVVVAPRTRSRLPPIHQRTITYIKNHHPRPRRARGSDATRRA